MVFKAYCLEIEEAVNKEGVPAIIVKVMSQCEFYRCRQYAVEVYQKSNLKKEVPGVEESMVLGIKRTKALLINKKKDVILTIEYRKVKEISVYASSIVFAIEGMKNEVRLDTIQSFEISKLIEKYNGSVSRKLSV